MKSEKIAEGHCCGCAACYAICPVGAITMKENENGFLVPAVDENICINCKACQNVCRSQNHFHKAVEVWIAKHRNKSIYLSSQSGGAFTAISDCILANRGVIYGAAMDANLNLIHIRAEAEETRNKMRGSKYIPSDISNVYSLLEQDLKNGRKVLFCGTPCQVSGILKYINAKKIDPSDLYTVDLLCHGVPSISLWRKLKAYYENKIGCRIQGAELRTVSDGKRPVICLKIKDTWIPDILHRKLYYSNLALRPACYQCAFTSSNRIGDFTIGDAWGVDQHHSSFADDQGVSLILFNTAKSLELQKNIRKAMAAESVKLEDYIQQSMQSAAAPKRSPEEFWHDFHNKNFSYIIEKYAKHNLLLNLKYVTVRLKNALMDRRKSK